ncbi:inositol polyphosphate multikinase [Pimephales promelas]|uniref:inositol polyphosphate multikinase n=1 Tax=Pimephales promelas TaxID=90988 RepID=UPI001955AB93|nr:inositol polyphosphate multikinase [Pimephales promelas]KAG1933785.1 inositol hexakisphosphate kinase [Pimephales promelas]
MENHLQKFFQYPFNLDKFTLNVSAEGQIMDSSARTLEKLEKDNKKKESVKQVFLDGCVPFSHQVAGHKWGINNTGVLQHPDGTILKQLQPPPRGPREMHFYTQVYAKDCTDTRLLDLQQHLPRFYGTWAPRESPHELYLKLEDVTKRFLRPCIMDVKIGKRSYDPFASLEKREEQISKYPLMEEIGFLLLGMRVYQINSDSYITLDQFYGRSLGKDTVKNGLTRFFHNGEALQRHALSLIISKIRSILRWFEGQTQLHFYASSLLLVYEGSPRTVNGWKHKRAETGTGHQQGEPQSNCNKPHEALIVQGSLTHSHPYRRETNANGVCAGSVEEEREEIGMGETKQFGQEDAVEVKMIDFAHVFPSNSPDEGYMYGLRNLLSTLEQILKTDI